jgi:hypothetical protein
MQRQPKLLGRHLRLTVLSFTAAVAVAALLGASGEQASPSITPPNHFAYLAPLVGHTWQGEFRNMDASHEQRLEWVYGGKFIRAKDTVHAGRQVRRGEGLFGWDAAEERIVYWYWSDSGFFNHGVMWEEDGYLRTREGLPDGTELRGRLIIHEDGTWERTLERKTEDGWEEVAAIHYERAD